MPLLQRPAFTFTALALASTLAACGGGGSEAPDTSTAGPQTVQIQFAAVAGSQAVGCGTPLTGLGSTGATAQLRDLRFYIANAALVRADGVEVPVTLGANDAWNLTVGQDRVTLIDLENATGACPSATGTAGTNAVLKGQVPAGNYTGVKLSLGVPFALNHSDWANPATTSAPLDIQALAWSWQGGRKFAKIEVTDPLAASPVGTPGKWSASTFNVHLGSTGCVGNPATGTQVSGCAAPNRMEFTLPQFNPATQKIAVDLQALLASTDITANTTGTAAGCMSGGTDPECLNVFKALAIDWQADGKGTGLPVQGGASQTVFRAVAP
ncbi:MAG: metallo-mystery pair system four-Cys motif protein [Burkholderiaceae bacterium]|nr:metallo-mystery pair system four-Cys motif protein [Burkholderiaceae bacterium]